MGASRFLAIGLFVCALAPKAVHAQSGGQRAATAADSLRPELLQQARTRFAQAGVEPSQISWDLLVNAIDRGIGRLGRGAAFADSVSLTRRSLNSFVDDMIRVASFENGGLVAHESTFSEAMVRCKPAKYPICP